MIFILGAMTLSDAEPSAPFYADKQNLLMYLDGKGKAHPVRTVSDWKRRRAHILANMQQVMGTMPDRGRRVPTGWSHKGYMPRIAEVYGKDPHPDCEHDFPPEVREAAYRFVDRALQVGR